MKKPIYVKNMEQKTKEAARRFRVDDEKTSLFFISLEKNKQVRKQNKTKPTESNGVERKGEALALWVDEMKCRKRKGEGKRD